MFASFSGSDSRLCWDWGGFRVVLDTKLSVVLGRLFALGHFGLVDEAEDLRFILHFVKGCYFPFYNHRVSLVSIESIDIYGDNSGRVVTSAYS